MLRKVSTMLSVFLLFAGASLMQGQESQAPSDVIPDQIKGGHITIDSAYQLILLEPVRGLKSQLLVYNQELAQFEKLPDARLRASRKLGRSSRSSNNSDKKPWIRTTRMLLILKRR